MLNGSILSDFFTLSALISVGFAVCPLAPSWSAMVSYRACSLFLSFFKRFLTLFSCSCFEISSRIIATRSYLCLKLLLFFVL